MSLWVQVCLLQTAAVLCKPSYNANDGLNITEVLSSSLEIHEETHSHILYSALDLPFFTKSQHVNDPSKDEGVHEDVNEDMQEDNSLDEDYSYDDGFEEEDDEDYEYDEEDVGLHLPGHSGGYGNVHEAFLQHSYGEKVQYLHNHGYGDPADADSPDEDQLYSEYGVVSERLEQPLENEYTGPMLLFPALAATPHGRHLLLVTLLEAQDKPLWAARCENKLSLYLPDSLRMEDQPPFPGPPALLLPDVTLDEELGSNWTRDMLEARVRVLAPPDMLAGQIFSGFNETEQTVLAGLTELVNSQSSFSASFTLLAGCGQWVFGPLWEELVVQVILTRPDCGMLLPGPAMSPSPEQLPSHEREVGEPEDEDATTDIDDQAVGHSREKRQAWRWRGQGGGGGGCNPNQDGVVYWREDAVLNSHHVLWHRLGRRRRWCEMFYWMHNQAVARYRGELHSIGRSPPGNLMPPNWGGRIECFRSRDEGRMGGSRRRTGSISGRNQRQLGQMSRRIERSARRYSRGSGRWNGEDRGIEGFACEVEQGIHNFGHVAVSQDMGGLMGGFEAMRDPIFWRWHGYVEYLFFLYKSQLRPYRPRDLNFPGVQRIEVEARDSAGGPLNTLYTFMRRARQIEFLQHRPYTITVNIRTNRNNFQPQPGVVRLFLLPWPMQRLHLPIQLDMWRVDLQPGNNVFQRQGDQAPHLATPFWNLQRLQRRLMRGSVSWGRFSDAGCGWPRHLQLPRGGRGVQWRLVAVLSPPGSGGWGNSWGSWGMCGTSPDSRPLGFPFDRPQTLDSLQERVGRHRNWAMVNVDILHNENP